MPDWLIQAIVVIGAVFSAAAPAAIWILTRFHEANKAVLSRIEQKTEHIDDCVDKLKQRVSRIEGSFGRGRWWLKSEQDDA